MKKYLVGLIVLIILGIFAFDLYMDKKAEEKVKKYLKNFEYAKYENVNYALLSGDIEINKLYIKDKDTYIKAEKILVKDFGPEEYYLKFFGIEDKDLKKFSKELENLGFKNVKFNASFKCILKENTINCPGNSFEAYKVFKTSVGFSFSNVDFNFWKTYLNKKEYTQEDTAKFVNEFEKINFVYFKFRYEDYGLKERYIEKLAKDSGISKDKMKKEIIKEIESKLKKARTKVSKTILEEVKKFIENERSRIFEIELKPDNPVKLRFIIIKLLTSEENELDNFLKNELKLKVRAL